MTLSLPGPGLLAALLLFSLLGFAAWRYGKATGRPVTRWLGVALMLFPYVVSATWAVWLVGLGLCAGIWWDHRR